MAEGKPNKIIAFDMQISEATVKAHVTEILRKIGVHSRSQAIVLAQRLALEPAHDRRCVRSAEKASSAYSALAARWAISARRLAGFTGFSRTSTRWRARGGDGCGIAVGGDQGDRAGRRPRRCAAG